MKIKNLMDGKYNNLFNPYIIAEAGVNHEGSIDIAKRLIEEAKEGGAHAIKFQTYKAETLASKNSPAYWDTTKEPTTSQFQLFKKHDSFWKKEFEILRKVCEENDIEFMSTPFDYESAFFLNELMDCFKVSSSDLTNKPFLELIAGFNKPIILSTGASYAHEIEESLKWIHDKNETIKVALLHCVLNYPTSDSDANLLRITGLQEKFPDYNIGYSDHTMPKDMLVSEIATLMGCSIIEKHFTHDKSLPGNDHYHAMDKTDLKHFLVRLERINELLGYREINNISSQFKARENARRSLVLARDVKKGEVLSREDLITKRPGTGLEPKYLDFFIGKVASRDLSQDDLLTHSMIK